MGQGASGSVQSISHKGFIAEAHIRGLWQMAAGLILGGFDCLSTRQGFNFFSSPLLAAGARDNCVKVWAVQPGGRHDVGAGAQAGVGAGARAGAGSLVGSKPLLLLPPFPSAVTAVAWAPANPSIHSIGTPQGNSGSQAMSYLLAVGLEGGQLQLWRVGLGTQGQEGSSTPGQSCSAACVWASTQFSSCAGQVNSLAWRRVDEGQWQEGQEQVMQVAVASADHSVRVLRVDAGRA